MDLRHVIALSFVCIFLSHGMSSADVSQYFDSDGNPISRPASAAPGNRGYFTPEGVELQKDIRYEFYLASGKTFPDIVRSAEENSTAPLRNKKRLPSRLEWTVGWSYKIAHSYGIDEEDNSVHAAVEIYDLALTYNITITLPALIDDTALNPAEKSLWKNYYLRLLEYESDHAKIIRDHDAQEELKKKFDDLNYVVFDNSSDIDIQKTVETFIRKETEKIGGEWVRSLKKRIDEYDRATDYGNAHDKRDAFFSQRQK
jgi:hypothetical protein